MKLLTAFLSLIFLSVASVAFAQELFVSDSRSQAMGGASVALSGCWSAFANQAGLATIDGVEIGGSFQNRFLVKELSVRAGLLVVPVQNSVFAVSLYQFGSLPFRQEKFGFAYARSLSPKLSLGVQFNYYRLFISENNRSAGSAGVEFGFQYLVTNRLVFGAHVLNPYQTGIKTFSGNFFFPSRINVGAFYQFSDVFGITSELENDFDRHLVVKTGMEYVISKKFSLKTGVSGKPYQLSAGIGFVHQKLTVDIASTYGQYLGNSPSVSFQYQF